MIRTMIATLPNGTEISHTTEGYGHSVNDTRAIPTDFWIRLADALNLSGSRECVGIDVISEKTTSVEGATLTTYRVRVVRGRMLAPMYSDYTNADSAEVTIMFPEWTG